YPHPGIADGQQQREGIVMPGIGVDDHGATRASSGGLPVGRKCRNPGHRYHVSTPSYEAIDGPTVICVPYATRVDNARRSEGGTMAEQLSTPADDPVDQSGDRPTVRPRARQRRVTRADVARAAGTSSAVVSYVVNDGPR